MASPRTLADLRARCPSCVRTVAVRRYGASWRMLAHRGPGVDAKDCRVRGVDALPLIREYLRHLDEAAARHDANAKLDRAGAAARLREAEQEEAEATKLRAKCADLTALLDEVAR